MSEKTSIVELIKKMHDIEDSLIAYRRSQEDLLNNLDEENMPRVWQKVRKSENSVAVLEQNVTSMGSTISGITSWQSGVDSSISTIEQNVNSQGASISSITMWQGGVDSSISSLNGTVGSHATSITSISQEVSAQEAKISLVVGSSSGDDVIKAASIVAAINDAGSSVKISSDHISLAGKTINLTGDNISISSTNFSVTKDGVVMAKSGTIGGWSINPTYLGSSQTGGSFYIAGPGDTSPYWIRAHNAAGGGGSMTFAVSKDGSFTATKGSISGDVQINGSCLINGTLSVSKIQRSTVSGDLYVNFPDSILTPSVHFGSPMTYIVGDSTYMTLYTGGTVYITAGSGLEINVFGGGKMEFDGTNLYVNGRTVLTA